MNRSLPFVRITLSLSLTLLALVSAVQPASVAATPANSVPEFRVSPDPAAKGRHFLTVTIGAQVVDWNNDQNSSFCLYGAQGIPASDYPQTIKLTSFQVYVAYTPTVISFVRQANASRCPAIDGTPAAPVYYTNAVSMTQNVYGFTGIFTVPTTNATVGPWGTLSVWTLLLEEPTNNSPFVNPGRYAHMIYNPSGPYLPIVNR